MLKFIVPALLLALAPVAEANLPLETSLPVRTVARVEAPKQAKGADRPRWALFMVGVSTGGIGDGRHVPLAPYGSGQDLPDNRRGVTLLAVRPAKVKAFHAAIATEVAKRTKRHPKPAHPDSIQARMDRYQAVRTVIATNPRWYAMAPEALGGRTHLDPTDPTRTIRESYRVTSIEGGTIHLKRTSRRLFDKSGKELTPAEAEQQKLSTNRLLVALAFLGLIGLLGVIARRLRAVPATATAAG